ncbi:hypothetical protein [Kitasatospora viridis]|uniref:Uncharacterized protein n=1 Tax=Kitasatospora viridis TaxID=281105 RepID=A0A561TSP2_9ACTN|nr:hypothetical protein [Kitasatospora viridis]TWF90107.1 hypothetical protein FHX73_13151 [Kitasatospora viridis]
MKIAEFTHVWLERDGSAAWLREGRALTCLCPLREEGGCTTVGGLLPALGGRVADSRGSVGRLVAVRREFNAVGDVVRTAVGLHRTMTLGRRSRSWVYQCAVVRAARVRPVETGWISPGREYLSDLYARVGSVDGVADALRVSSGLARRVLLESGVALRPRGTVPVAPGRRGEVP